MTPEPSPADEVVAAAHATELLTTIHHVGPTAMRRLSETYTDLECRTLVWTLTGMLYSATVDMSRMLGVPVEHFLQVLGLNVARTQVRGDIQ